MDCRNFSDQFLTVSVSALSAATAPTIAQTCVAGSGEARSLAGWWLNIQRWTIGHLLR
jgi:hypothetical protein